MLSRVEDLQTSFEPRNNPLGIPPFVVNVIVLIPTGASIPVLGVNLIGNSSFVTLLTWLYLDTRFIGISI